ncbi:MAG: hypothetical protein WC052_01105 [Patescibacteria group bacterium]
MTSRLWQQRLLFAALPFSLFLGGCITDSLFGGGTAEPVAPAGVYRSTDHGDTWATVNQVLTVGGERLTMDDVNVRAITLDPTDRQTVYVGTSGNGLYYTYDAARRWWQSGPIRSGSINAIAIPNDVAKRCTVYLASANRVLKTIDCGRFWEQVYFDTRTNELTKSLLVHQKNPDTVFIGMSTGEVLRSKDAGTSWETVARMQGSVIQLLSAPLNPELLYALVAKKGVWVSEDGGTTWTDAGETMKKDFKGSEVVTAAAIDTSRPDTFIVASKYGLVRTTDAGKTWVALSLLTPTGKITITDVALRPDNSSELYYTTPTTFYRSYDAGGTWETQPLPAINANAKIIVDPKVNGLLYLGIARIVQQQESLIGF